MSHTSEPAISVPVDPTNPGQFFACCGLLELADRLWGGAEGWFDGNLLHRRIDGLLRKAIVQAGFSQVLADHADLEWRSTGFWPGTDLARHYGVPEHLRRFSRYHVRLKWCDERGRPVNVPGPICIGGGRFYGLGLFAAL